MGSGSSVEFDNFIGISRTDSGLIFTLSGEWILKNLSRIEKAFHDLRNDLSSFPSQITVDVSKIRHIDTSGMIFFIEVRSNLRRMTDHSRNFRVKGVRDNVEFLKMFRLISRYKRGETCPTPDKKSVFYTFFEKLGQHFFNAMNSMLLFFDFIGRTYAALLRDLLHFSFRVREITNLVKKAGVTALPIIGITTFLIGVVIAFQSAVQLQQYGANIFIVEIVSIAIARELSPIIVSIVVAGRSGSAFTAQLGAMKITEELDAMSVMGFDIFRFLIVPRSVALIIVLPLLIFFGDLVGIFGGMLVAKFQLGITPVSFIQRLHKVFAMRHFYAGLIKGPFFAATIAAIGCFRGLQVTRDTESIGKQTTISVVNSIFMVIIIDAIFSILFTELGI